MRMKIRKHSAFLLLMVMLIQTLFTLPVGAESKVKISMDTGKISVLLEDSTGKAVTVVEPGQEYVLKIVRAETLFDESDEKITLALPFFFILGNRGQDESEAGVYEILPSEKREGELEIVRNAEFSEDFTIPIPV